MARVDVTEVDDNSNLRKVIFTSRGYSVIWAIKVCAAPKGMGFEQFWSKIGSGFYTLVLKHLLQENI